MTLRDFTITITCDDPSNFDRLEAVLQGNWDAAMLSLPTGDMWRKQGRSPETSLSAPLRMEVVEDADPSSLE